jgi:hypothetical protein
VKLTGLGARAILDFGFWIDPARCLPPERGLGAGAILDFRLWIALPVVPTARCLLLTAFCFSLAPSLTPSLGMTAQCLFSVS